MRIVGGSFSGRTIQAPEGDSTRPTTDRVREALFSTLYSLTGGFEGMEVLDAFAGCGALGLEAVSRGASRVVFCDSSKKACAVVKRNIASCGLEQHECTVITGDTFKLSGQLKTRGYTFDLVFLDPPYAYDPARVIEMIVRMDDAGLLGKDALIAYEHDIEARENVETLCAQAGYTVRIAKKYGKTGISIVKCNE